MIKAVFFDVDNTLYDFERVRRYGLNVALQHIYEHLPNTRGRLTVQHLIELREQAAEEAEGSRLDLVEIRTESFRRALAMCGYGDELAPELTRIYATNRFRFARPFEGALMALRGLRGRYVLGVISNANTPLECLGLESYFDHQFYAEDVGLAKPDPRIFEMAMSRVPCRPEQFVYVGDSIEFDVMGAMNAGARTVWFNPQSQSYPDGLARPDFEIADLAELIGIVEKIE
jgi:putative hydrolase of the HAD superfamily